MNRIRKKQYLVFNELFIRTCLVAEFLPAFARTKREMGATRDKDSLAFEYDLGQNVFAWEPTYQLHIGNFSKFVAGVEAIARRRKECPLYIPPECRGARFDMEKHYREATKNNKKIDSDWKKFQARHSAAFAVMVAVHHNKKMAEHMVPPYFNMDLYPRSGKEQQLIGRFIKAYSITCGASRLNIHGPKQGTQSIPASLLSMAENMRRKGRGTKAGSLETITSTVMEGMGFSPALPDDRGLRVRDNIYRTLLRHFARLE